MGTYSAKPTEVVRKWYVIDASEATLGRVATQVATLLTGKRKPMYTTNIDCGDYVIVINTDNLVVTGDKMESKMYYRHSGYPGGLSETSLKEVMAKDSTKAIFAAVRGMLPVNKLRDPRLLRLKLYAGSEHEHAPQKPEALSLKGTK